MNEYKVQSDYGYKSEASSSGYRNMVQSMGIGFRKTTSPGYGNQLLTLR